MSEMQVNVQRLSPVLVEFDVEVGVGKVTTELEKAYTQVARTARVRGFRPGKAPRKVLTHLYGARIAADVAQKLVDETFPQAVTDQKLQPVTSPAVEAKQGVEENKPFSYKARVEVLPEITGVSYEGLGAKRPKVDVSEEAITKELDAVRRAHSTLEPPKTPRPSANGDTVSIDFVVSVDGETIEDAGATDFQVELGGGTLLPQIEEGVLGKSTGEAATAEVPMPAQHPHPKLKGKTAKFAITVKDIKERVLPAADDEFAKDVGEFETLQALKDDIKKKLEAQAKEQSDNQLAEQLVLELVKANPVPVPPSLVERQMRITEQEILNRARSQGQRVTGLGDELRGKLVEDSEIKVRAGLLMAEIAKKEGIQIGNEEIENGLKELAEQTGQNLAKLRVQYKDQQKREMLIGMILENKVLDIIEAKAKIEEG
ncbi:MAG TPA: trigger factor [Polyangiaceae bacterium]|nr:trigger factor [Polyangiaceae bacterium]